MNKIIVCNHKMFLSRKDCLELKKNLDNLDINEIDLIICPNYLNFDIFSGYQLGAQDAFYAQDGAYTSKISASNLSEIGIKYSIVGHSYMRRFDTDDIVNLKVKAILDNNMIPILCIGEEDENRKSWESTISKQLKDGLKGIDKNSKVIIAYEPIWTIGTGKIIDSSGLEESVNYIKKLLSELEINNYKILYGGSVTSSNISEISSNLVDGYLLGKSSASVNELLNIIKCIKA